jgi:hypothetical protein
MKTTKQIINEIKKGKFCTIKFIKRSNNEIRVLTGRTGIKKGLTGKGSNYSFEAKNLLPITDIKIYNKTKDIKKSRRAIPIDNIVEVKINKQTYNFNEIAINESIDKIKQLNKIILK